MIFVRKIWIFLDELSGVIGTIVYVYLGIQFLLGHFKSYKLLTTISFVALPLILLSISKWTKYTYKKYKTKIVDFDVTNEIKILEQTSSHKDIDKILPNNKLLSKLDEIIVKKAKDWSEDALRLNFTFYLDVTEKKVDLNVQERFISKWKNEERYFYSPKVYQVISSELANINISSSEVIPFYVRYENWKFATIKAFKAIENRIPPNYQLIIPSHYEDCLHITFKYVAGIEKSEIFELRNNELKNIKTGQYIAL